MKSAFHPFNLTPDLDEEVSLATVQRATPEKSCREDVFLISFLSSSSSNGFLVSNFGVGRQEVDLNFRDRCPKTRQRQRPDIVGGETFYRIGNQMPLQLGATTTTSGPRAFRSSSPWRPLLNRVRVTTTLLYRLTGIMH